MKHFYILTALLLLPTQASAAQLVCETIDSIWELGPCTILFFNITLVPFLFSLALLFFIYFVIRYFIIEVNNTDGKAKAKRYALYSISGFVLMVSIWGVVNLLVEGTFGADIGDPVCPDVIPGTYSDCIP